MTLLLRYLRFRPAPGKRSCLGQTLVWSGLVLALFSGFAAATPETDVPAPTGFTAFKSIPEQNIFDTTRTRHRRGEREAERAPRVDTITLYGTFIYDKGPFAFFTGSGSEYQQVLSAGKSIAGYAIAEITGNGVKLTAGTNTIQLQVGMQLRRPEGGEWQVAGGSAAPAVPGGNMDSTAEDTSSSDASDVEKKLMKQRQQELQ